MFQSVLAPSVSHNPPVPVPCARESIRPIGCPRRMEGDLLARILGRCGRVSDTTDPPRYGALFTATRKLFGQGLRWGMMVPVNLVLERIVYHSVYRQKRMPQMAPMLLLFQRNEELWTARAVLFIRPEPDSDDSAEAEIISLYADFGVEVLILRPEWVDSGYLDTVDFKDRLARAVYAPCAVSPLPTPTRRVAVA